MSWNPTPRFGMVWFMPHYEPRTAQHREKPARRHIAGAVLLLVFVLVQPAWAQPGPVQVTGGPFTVEHTAGDTALAQRSLDILEEGLASFSAQLPSGDAPIRVVICHTMSAFTNRAGAYGKAHVGGIARSQQGVIIVKAPDLLPPGEDYGGMLRHELIHVLLARNTNEANVPRWFDEGIAMLVSKELRWESGLRIAHMYARGRVIPYREKNLAFAPLGSEETFGDAYAQALSLSYYLRDKTGEARFWDLLHALKSTPFEEALRQYTGLTPMGLYDGWRKSLWKFALITSLVSGFSAFQLMAILVIVVYLKKRHQGRQLLKQWEEEENDPPLFTWESVEDEPYPWEEEDDDERF